MAKNVRQNAIKAQTGTNILHYTDYISIFIQQGNISFQNDFSPKTVRLRVLSWDREKADKKHDRETYGRIVRVSGSASSFKYSWTSLQLVCLTQPFLVSSRNVPPHRRRGGALRDDNKNGCVADYSTTATLGSIGRGESGRCKLERF